MAGYVFAIGGDEDPVSMIRECAEKGTYSTYLKGIAPLSFEGTLADYMSMRPGDNIYFFCKRRNAAAVQRIRPRERRLRQDRADLRHNGGPARRGRHLCGRDPRTRH